MRRPNARSGGGPAEGKTTGGRRGLALFGLAAGLLLGFSSAVLAEPEPIPRTVLALYDPTEDYSRREDDTFCHRFAEMVLNHLGLIVRYHDLSEGLPPPEKLEGVRGVLTWFHDDALTGASAYWRWALEQLQAGRRFVILGEVGALLEAETGRAVPSEAYEPFFEKLGLAYEGFETDNPLLIELEYQDPEMIGFERAVEGQLKSYAKVLSLSDENRVYLVLHRTDIADGLSAAVAVSSRGGVALGDTALFFDDWLEQGRWRVNPFRFFSEAFGVEGFPKLDTTTLFGRRIFYTHIDGDGFRNLSRLGERKSSGEIIYEEILQRYRIPITVSFISAEIDPDHLGSGRLQALARRILTLPHVEIGVHGFSHPLDWEAELVAFEIPGYSRTRWGQYEAQQVQDSSYDQAALVRVDRAAYLRREVADATEQVNRLVAPPGKKAVIYQWTGNCEPPAEAIRLSRGLGLKNINGGDSRFDREIPSYTGVAPLTRQIDTEVQVYTSNANENIYTNEWSGPFDGFRHVIQTFSQTERPTLIGAPPRRVSPMNVYYHFYSGERQASLKAVRQVYDEALAREVTPIFTSEYVSVVEGFLSARLTRLPDGGWRITDYGDCRTLRFDGESRVPDLKRSSGVLGFTRWEDALYVHLEKGGRATVYLAARSAAAPYLEQASAWVEGLALDGREISFSTRGHGEGLYRFRNLRPGAAYRLVQTQGPPAVFRADESGTLEVRLPLAGERQVRLRAGRDED